MPRPIIEPPPEPGGPRPPLASRLGWFAGLAIGGALVTIAAAWLLKALLR
jgi:hypothetical protein